MSVPSVTRRGDTPLYGPGAALSKKLSVLDARGMKRMGGAHRFFVCEQLPLLRSMAKDLELHLKNVPG